MPQYRFKYASDRIPNWVFYCPFAYLGRVRLGTIEKRLSWLMLYIVPTLYYSSLLADLGARTITFFLNYCLLLIAVFGIYELGYIYNDTRLLRREKDATVRLYPRNRHYFKSHWKAIYVCRSMVIMAAIMGFVCLNTWSVATWITLVSIILVIPIFAAYNACRNRCNVLIYPLLVLSRYVPLLMPYIMHEDFLLAMLFMLLYFPLCISIERFSMPRYRYRFARFLIPTEESKTMFRVLYYTVIVILSIVVMCICNYPKQQIVMYVAPLVLMLVYRAGVYIIVRHYTPKNYLNG